MRAAHWTLFAALFAVALLCHQLWWHGFELASPRLLIVAAAVWLLLRPSSVGRFALLAGVTVVVLAADLPFVLSHLLVVLVVGVTVLLRLATARLRGPVGPEVADDALGGFLRSALLSTYAISGLAKLNTAFLDPATSCAGPQLAAVTWFAPGLLARPELVGPAIVATVVVELTLPLLLALPRTRVLALVAGIGFHVVLAAAGNVPFSALAFAFYAVFLPPAAAARLVDAVGRALPGPGRGRLALGVGAVLLATATWVGGAGATGAAPGTVTAVVTNGTRVVVAIVAVALLAALVAGGRGRVGPDRRRDGPPSPLVRSPILVAGLVVLILNGASPYLGFKTESSLEMFSGLRTEPGTWNHVVVPEAVRSGTLQDPLRVVGGEPSLVARGGGPVLLVRGEVERVLRATPGAVAVVETPDGTRSMLGPLPGGPTVADRVAWYRDVTAPPLPRC